MAVPRSLPPRPAWPAALLAALLLPNLSCQKDIEGNNTGECEDGADNDSDGYFDCGDSDCFGAPVCNGGGDDDDDDTSADDDTASDDDTSGDDDTSDDDDTTDDDTTVGDDDTTVGDGVTPYISAVDSTFNAAAGQFTFSIEAHDPDENFGVPLLLWSVDGAPQTPVTVGSVPLLGDCWFDVQLSGATPGTSYQVLFAIRDADNHVSEGFLVNAVAQ